MSNTDLAISVLQACARWGVREIVLCAGARNAPLVAALTASKNFHTYSFFEERSAAFFALGRIMASHRPVAVITTSGTAAAELLPATIEADYQGRPLLLITADRPSRYRGSGAPQTIVQPGLFSHYVEHSLDIEGNWEGRYPWSGRRPLHLNVCFDEPLLEGQVEPWSLGPSETFASALKAHSAPVVRALRPLVIVGGLPENVGPELVSLLREWRRPLYLEAPSQLRGHPDLSELELFSGDFSSLNYDSVIHIGSVPTLRLWRDLENSTMPVYHFSHLPFTGLPRSKEIWPLHALRDVNVNWIPLSATELDGDRSHTQKLLSCLSQFPLSEPTWVYWLSRQLPERARLFLGNSLPIREWDLAAARGNVPLVFANRGVNGIDGLISTFIGVSDPDASNWALIGDLTAMYDLSGPWAFSQTTARDMSIVILNNGGGKIFKRIFDNPLFENQHKLHFGHWAEMWHMEYLQLHEPLDLPRPTRPRVIEIVPSATQTDEFWRAWEGE